MLLSLGLEDVALHLVGRDRVGRRLRGKLELVVDERVHVLVRPVDRAGGCFVQTLQPRLGLLTGFCK